MANFDMIIDWAKENATLTEMQEVLRIEANEWMDEEEEAWLKSICDRS